MKKISKEGIIVLICTLVLSFIGLISVYSASRVWASYLYNDPFYYLKRQALFLSLGIVLFIIGCFIKKEYLKKYATHFLLFSFILLVGVLIPGLGKVRNGSRSWYMLGSLAFQPSELFKVSIIIFASKYLEKNFKNTKYFFKGITPLLLLAFLGFALIMLQPDFGTGLVMFLTIILLTLVSKVEYKNYLKIAFIGLLAMAFLIISEPYRMERISAYINPWSDPLGSGFQAIQALFAIGPGGFLGLGWNNSIQKHYFLPEPQTDFIFAIICEELGFLGGSLIIITFIILIYYALKIALNAKNKFDMFLVVGIIFLLAIQVLINLGVVVGLLPVTGITLPFLSYGGSSLTILLFLMGIIINISRKEDLNENSHS